MNASTDPAVMQETLDKYTSGLRYPNKSPRNCTSRTSTCRAQPYSAPHRANCETGGNGGMAGGTLVATNAMSGAARTDETPTIPLRRRAGAEAIGCN
jgi:beta-N-acetylhexosaminidase